MKSGSLFVCAAGCAFALTSTTETLQHFAPLAGSPAHAADACTTDVAKDELSDAQALALFDCIKERLYSGLQRSGLAEAKAYRDWPMASTNPFISATHGNRFVNHYVNETGREAYLKWDAIGGRTMPVGSIAAKESFNITKNGEVRPGPFFLMEKVSAGSLPETDDWKYTLMFPNGKVVGVSGTETGGKVKFCHDCHVGVLEDQDALFFPDEAYRVRAN
ncbi:MAG: cytochrome P460 family protein [Pseudomonadota bacterium]